MKKIEQPGPLLAGYYLLEEADDYDKAILQYLSDLKLKPVTFGLQEFSIDGLVQMHRLKGNRHRHEHTFPHVLVIHYIDEPDQLIVDFISKEWFEVLSNA